MRAPRSARDNSICLSVSPEEVNEVAALVKRLIRRGWRVYDRGQDRNGRYIEFIGTGDRDALVEDVIVPTITNYPEPVLAEFEDADGVSIHYFGAGERSGLMLILDTHVPGGIRLVEREGQRRRYGGRRIGFQGVLPPQLAAAGVEPTAS